MGIPIAPLDPEIQISLKKSELKSIQHALIEVGGHEHIWRYSRLLFSLIYNLLIINRL